MYTKMEDTKENAIAELLASGKVQGKPKINYAVPDPIFMGIWRLKKNVEDTEGWLVCLPNFISPSTKKTRTKTEVYSLVFDDENSFI